MMVHMTEMVGKKRSSGPLRPMGTIPTAVSLTTYAGNNEDTGRLEPIKSPLGKNMLPVS